MLFSLINLPHSNIVHAQATYEVTDYSTDFNQALDRQMTSRPQTDVRNHVGAYIRSDGLNVSGSSFPTTATVRNSTTGAATNWNVRGGSPGTSNPIIGTVRSGANVNVLSKVRASDGWDWYNIQLNSFWNHANRDGVSHYLNSTNFDPNSNDYFQFIKLNERAGISASDLNNRILNGKGALSNTGQAFIQAANTHGVNEVYLISHALLETGNGGSELARGIQVNGQTVYNMYGIGAFDHCAKSCGADHAYKEGWFTPEAAIIGGAKFVANNYFSRGQDTLYKMRWNPSSPGTYQYATDIGWAVKQTGRMASLYNLVDNYTLRYDIPRYKNQPGSLPEFSKVEQFPDGVEGYTTTSVNLRSQPVVADNTRISTLNNNIKVAVLGKNDNNWYNVSVNGQTGWISGDYLDVVNLLQVSTTSSNLNVRSQANSSSSTIGSVANHAYLAGGLNGRSIIKNGSWYQINHNGRAGWVHVDFVKIIAGSTVDNSTTVQRIQGDTRYITSSLISQRGWNQSDVVVLARGDRFSDALAGVPLAAKYNAPLLISRSNRLDDVTKAELSRLKAKEVIILGGPLAINESVESSLKSMGINKVRRIEGRNMHDTAALIANEVAPNGSKKAIIVNDSRFHDALSIASYAGNENIPILLTQTDSVPEATKNAIKKLGVTETMVIGGELMLSKNAEKQLPKPSRIAGNNRFETNIQVLQFSNPSANHVYIATSADFPDGLSAAALATKENAGIVLVDGDLRNTTTNYLQSSNFSPVKILGGPLAIDDKLMQQISSISN
ncbi:cell wall-binding repeat-containing protein [Alkalihalophilus sp. As8PL]|uniref:Cell wall-binding repeat-containing protein n=1 Tax=Alkalihalophilus sp. As8PL TaxID=3237103 RepID=A0AB39BPF5_9BACI